MENQKFNVDESLKAQRDLQKQKGYPGFAPSDGICYRCKRQIYAKIENKNEITGETYFTGVSVEKASSELITGCPHCHRSYCD